MMTNIKLEVRLMVVGRVVGVRLMVVGIVVGVGLMVVGRVVGVGLVVVGIVVGVGVMVVQSNTRNVKLTMMTLQKTKNSRTTKIHQ